jgi:hypothetical protein
MTVEISCPGCGRKLHVDSEDQGKQIRCPVCQQISAVPAMAENPQMTDGQMAGADGLAATNWHMRTPEGAVYGPVGWTQVESWATEGRIAADCELAESDDGPWRAATELIPQLSAGEALVASAPGPQNYPYDAGGAAEAHGYVLPHRGGLLVFLGFLGFGLIGLCPVFSPILGLITWVIASRDLAEMRAARMDKSGEKLTQAGWIMGIVLSLLWMIVLLGGSIIALIVGLASYW